MGMKHWICGNAHIKGQHCTLKDKYKLHHLPTDWYNCISHADYNLLLNWVNIWSEITWNDGMDPSNRQAIVPATLMGGTAITPTGNNDNVTIIL